MTNCICFLRKMAVCAILLSTERKKKGGYPLLLSELEPGSSVQLLLTMGDKKFEFTTTVYARHKHHVLFEPIRKDGKILNVQKEDVSLDIMYLRQDEKPVLWQNAELSYVRHRHELYYAAEADWKGREYNRRGAYRLYIGEEIRAKIGQARKSRIVHLKDISSSGFAFIYDEEIADAEGMFVSLKYVAELEGNVKELSMHGKVVRCMPLEDGRFLYGCALLKKNEMIGHYINQKQMEQLANKNERFSNKEKD